MTEFKTDLSDEQESDRLAADVAAEGTSSLHPMGSGDSPRREAR
jgi:hypothetical protein